MKTGTESFMLRNLSVKRGVKEKEKIRIVVSYAMQGYDHSRDSFSIFVFIMQLSTDEECPMWQPPQNPFTVMIKDPEKKKKFKGVVSYVAYQVIPSVSQNRNKKPIQCLIKLVHLNSQKSVIHLASSGCPQCDDDIVSLSIDHQSFC